MTAPSQTRVTPSARAYEYEEERGQGWMLFAATLLLTIGTMNIIQGISAVGNANFYVHNTHYVFGSLNTWGWVVLCMGVVQVLVGIGLFAKNQLARWVGIFALSLNAIAQLLAMPAYPFWSLSIFAIDIVALYGLAAYGGRMARA
jgi:uncharacterized membrane-anchored protein